MIKIKSGPYITTILGQYRDWASWTSAYGTLGWYKLHQEVYVNGKEVKEIRCNGELVWPEEFIPTCQWFSPPYEINSSIVYRYIYNLPSSSSGNHEFVYQCHEGCFLTVNVYLDRGYSGVFIVCFSKTAGAKFTVTHRFWSRDWSKTRPTGTPTEETVEEIELTDALAVGDRAGYYYSYCTNRNMRLNTDYQFVNEVPLTEFERISADKLAITAHEVLAGPIAWNALYNNE